VVTNLDAPLLASTSAQYNATVTVVAIAVGAPLLASASQLYAHSIPGEATADSGGKGGFDPYYYKKRNKRRDKKKDVEAFVREIEQAPIEQAPAFIQEQAEEALEASRRALRLEELDALQKALSEINEFYSLVRVEAKRRREEEEDDELLLLS
jgi:hypothetical protein